MVSVLPNLWFQIMKFLWREKFQCPNCRADLVLIASRKSDCNLVTVPKEFSVHSSGKSFSGNENQCCRLCGFTIRMTYKWSGKVIVHYNPDFFLSSLNPDLWLKYKSMQLNGFLSYHLLTEASCSTSSNQTAKRFANFILSLKIPFRSKVLDVGCGTLPLPHYLSPFRNYSRLWGLDPFNSRFKGNFVLGSIERTPFKNSFFDIAVCATSIDHFFDLTLGVKELARIIKQGGFLLIWHHSRASNQTTSEDLRFQIYVNGVVLPILPGALDPFHLIETSDLSAVLKESGFELELEDSEFEFQCWRLRKN